MSLKSIIESTPARKAFYNLVSGNALVFILQILGLYITLTFYSREALSIYTLFVTLTYLSTKLTTLRLPELLIREPDENVVRSSANAILTLILMLSGVILIIYFILARLGIDFQLFDNTQLRSLFPLFAIAVLISSLSQLWSSLLLKQDKTRQLSIGRILKSSTQIITMLVFIAKSEYGLLYAWVFGLIIEIIFSILVLRSYKLSLAPLSSIISLIKKNKDIVYYTLPISLLLSIHDNIIVQSIEYFYGPMVLAVFAVVDRVLRLPSQIIGGAASQVLYKYGSDTFNQSSGQYYKQFWRGLTRISLVFIICVVSCMLLAYPVFDLVFDGKWSDASHYLVKYGWWILPFSLMAVLRNVPVMLKLQREYFLLELGLVICIGISLYFVGSNSGIDTFYQAKFGIELLFFVVMIWSVIKLVKTKTKSSITT